jgi:hypothetical protein
MVARLIGFLVVGLGMSRRSKGVGGRGVVWVVIYLPIRIYGVCVFVFT